MSFGPRRFPRLTHYRPLPPSAAADADLLARWAADRDEAAFELLVRRHSPVVLGVCRRLLSDPNDADDAFQATFLVLARKAGSIARAEVVAAWLHRVAYRAALRVRADRGRRTTREPADIDHIPGPPPADPGWAELPRVLDEEIGRLPARHRAAFILCCLEGKTGEEAGRLLGCPPGTISSRLTRARERLRDRLTRRGFAPAAVAAAVAALDRDAPAALSPAVDSTIHAALAFAGGTASPAGPPTRPAAIAEGVLRTMTLIRIKLAALFVAAGLLAAGGLFAGTGPAADPDQPPPRKAADEKAPQRAKNADEKALPEVRLVEPRKGGLDRVATMVGTAEPAQRVDLYPAATGFVNRVTVDIGDRVKVGDVLAEIDAPDLVLDQRQAVVGVQQAESLLKEAEARVMNMKAEVMTAIATVHQREGEAGSAKADSEVRKVQLDNTKRLFEQKVVSKDELKIHENNYLSADQKAKAADAAIETAKAGVDVAKSKLAQAEAAVSTAKANAEVAKIGLDKARLAVARTKIVAPFDGIVTRRNAAAGDSVRAGDAAGRHPLLTLVRVDTVRVVVRVPARQAAQVKPGTPAELSFNGPPGEKFAGKVSRVGYELDAATATMRAEIDLPNPDGKLRPGMAGMATLTLGKGPPDALRVPRSAVRLVGWTDARTGRPESYVYVYRDGKARKLPVKLSYESGNEVEISSGLTAEDRVVAEPNKLSGYDEVPVRVKK